MLHRTMKRDGPGMVRVEGRKRRPFSLRVLSKQWQGEFCRCSIDVVGGKLVASTMSSAFDTTQAESGQTNDATDC